MSLAEIIALAWIASTLLILAFFCRVAVQRKREAERLAAWNAMHRPRLGLVNENAPHRVSGRGTTTSERG